MSAHDSNIRLRHMLDYARDAVALAAQKTRTDLETDHMLDLALKHAVTLVGEAANHVGEEMQTRYPEIAWAQIVGCVIDWCTGMILLTMIFYGRL